MPTLATVRTAAKQLAQNNPTTGTTGVQLLLTDPGDYTAALLAALRILSVDRPNHWVKDHTLTVAGWRFVLAGDGGTQILPSDMVPDTPVAALAGAGAGNVDDGAHSWAVAHVLPSGVTQLSAKSNVVTVADQATDGQVDVSVPIGPTGTTARNLCRTVAGDTGDWKLVFQVAGNVTATYRDSVADSALGAAGATQPDLDAWIDGATALTDVWSRYLANTQGQEPDDPNGYRVVDDPGGLTVLELLFGTLAVGEVLRLIIRTPYVLHESVPSLSSVPAGLVEPLVVLGASLVLQLAANKAAQNTGNTSLPMDVVDRRTQSDIYRSRSKELRDLYNVLVGKAGGADLKGASAVMDMDVATSHGRGFLWHPTTTH